MRWYAIAAMLLIVFFLRIIERGSLSHPTADSLLALGFLIFAGYFLGEIAKKFNVPRITGYLISGLLCGPFVLKVVTPIVLSDLKMVDNIALALIAITAGSEINIKTIRKNFFQISIISIMQILFTSLLMLLLLYFVFPYFIQIEWINILILGLAVGFISSATSPSSSVAVIVDSGIHNIVSESVIAITVMKDIIVILLFAFLLSAVPYLKGVDVFSLRAFGFEVFLLLMSILVGAVSALLVHLYMRFVNREILLFVIILAIALVFVSIELNLHVLILCLTLGFVLQNFSRWGKRLTLAIEHSSTSIYIIFFALAGAQIRLDSLGATLPFALLIVITRAFSLQLGTSFGSFFGRNQRYFRKNGGLGFLSQAGVSLSMVAIVAGLFPQMRDHIMTLLIEVIAINELMGPIALKYFLEKTEKQ